MTLPVIPTGELPGAPFTFDTWEEWERFVQQPPLQKPNRPTKAETQTWTPSDWQVFNRQRFAYHSGFGPITTPTMTRIHADLLPLALENLEMPPGARPGAVIDGEGTLGKTTILAHFGRLYERELRHCYPSGQTRTGDIYQPALYITLRGNVSIKGLNKKIAKFYHTPGHAKPELRLTLHC